jgi:hypothetical protein
MANEITSEDLELLEEMGVDVTPEANGRYSQREERILAGFEEICRFIDSNGRAPRHGDGQDIFERLYAERLDRIRQLKECYELLKPQDRHGLLASELREQPSESCELSDEELLNQLGVDDGNDNDVSQLKHVRSRDEIRAAEEVAQRKLCADFAQFKPVFDDIQKDLKSGLRYTIKYKDKAVINKGDLFILDGQKAIVADMGEIVAAEQGRPNCRLRVVYDNGTESDLLLRSLQRALNKDKSSRRISLKRTDLGPLFSPYEEEEEDDLPTGYIYVLRSKSEHPVISQGRELIHKIGVTGGDVETRIASAKTDATFLLADVELVAKYKLANINRKALEALIHKVLDSARLDLEFTDRFGNPVRPREWFLVPVAIIDEVVDKIKDGTIVQYKYNADVAKLEKA